MTDTYIWQKFRQRFLAIDGKIQGENGEEIDIIAKRETDGGIEYTNVIEPNDTSPRENLKNDSGIWFEIFLLHSTPFQQELGTAGRNRWNLRVQININCPRGSGTYGADAAYDAISAQFKRGDIFDGIRVMSTASRSSARFYEDFCSVPVTIMLQADLTN